MRHPLLAKNERRSYKSKSPPFSLQFFFVKVAVIVVLTDGDGAGQGRAGAAFRSNHTVGLACK